MDKRKNNWNGKEGMRKKEGTKLDGYERSRRHNYVGKESGR